MRIYPIKVNNVDYKVEMEDAIPGITLLQRLRVVRGDFLLPVTEIANYSDMTIETPLDFEFVILPTHKSREKAEAIGDYAYDEAILRSLKEENLSQNAGNHPPDADGVHRVTLE